MSRKVTIANGKNVLRLEFWLDFIIKNPPNADKTIPISSGWCVKDNKPSIPNISWDMESPKPETIWIMEPIMTSCNPRFRIPWMEFFINKLIENKDATATIATPAYTTMCGSDQKNSGEFWIWFMASHIPAARITSGPVTARIEIIDNCKFDFMQRWLETFSSKVVSMI